MDIKIQDRKKENNDKNKKQKIDNNKNDKKL